MLNQIETEIKTKADAKKYVEKLVASAEEFAQIEITEMAKAKLIGSPLKATVRYVEELVDEVIYDYAVNCKIFCISGKFYTLKRVPKPYLKDVKKAIEKYENGLTM